MAITKNMMDNFSSIIEYVDEAESVNFHKIKKIVPVNGIWEERIFYEIKNTSLSVISWLNTHYGKYSYQNTWWATHDSIVMRDSIYTHWKLCE